ncbi:Peptide deformylase [Frankia canadensis]|uniref:Peptide deformylase n=1 Tax=Frankia canadensis TaxID=1836972 RepID=A0A2I2KYB9_9ACTN|nr:peptide deformylase [Frankia canadensis]SNQ50661.1 Peptide deformylase [Frankia canadensis]SOU57951.1 Peptide deformylase [Frankia canadensis]
MSYESGPYRVSPDLLARAEFRAACAARDFRMVFRLMKKYDGASQNRIASPVEGLSQSRVSRIMQGEDHIARLSLIERIADALRIPGAYFHLAARPWESGYEPLPAVPAPAEAGLGPPGAGGPGGAGVPGQAGAAGGSDPAAPPGAGGRGAAVAGGLVVEEDRAELRYDDGMYVAHQRRLVLNTGVEPVTRYLMRISVDRFPGDQERAARLYRRDPLSWDELQLSARCGDEQMACQVKTDWDALKEVWLLFENSRGRFPLYPGESTWIEYSYRVREEKWGPWFQRAVRVPTTFLSVVLDFPADVDPVVWGMETSMTADAFPFRTAIARTDTDDRRIFTWSTNNPPLHARYRLEWNFRAAAAARAGAAGEPAGAGAAATPAPRPSEQMAATGIVQAGESILRQPARFFELPGEAEDARRVVAELSSAMERVSALHTFGKGMGIAAPQIGINRAAAIVRSADEDTITLLNPRVIESSPETDQQYEGCLSFFDVRGLVPRPLELHVEHTDISGRQHITVYRQGLARLVAHEIDHLFGQLYTDRMRPGTAPIPVEQYRGTGSAWTYSP